jgi:plasmid stabilization system protein ParE
VKINILDLAERDLIEGFRFYEAQEAGLGSYFINNLYSDIESLALYAGIHEKPFKDYYRLLSRRFPFAIFYTFSEGSVSIHAVLDCRSNPAWLRARLT